MRVPQRNFVVEYKSHSRQAKLEKAASIWGDTDLKAVALQVEEHAPHLFDAKNGEPAAAHDVPSEVERKVPSEQPVDCPAAPAETEVRSASASDTETTADTFIEGIPDAPVYASERTVSKDRPTIRLGLKRQKAAGAGHVGPSEMLETGRENDAFWSDLDALEAENSRLKALMRDRLVSDNARLKQMLSRFS